MTSSIPDSWDVYRDANGRPVVLTPDQVRAVWHAIRVVDSVRDAEHADPIGRDWQSDLFKSRLLGRLLVGGKPPLPGPADALPRSMGAVDYERAEQELGHAGAHTGYVAVPVDWSYLSDWTSLPLVYRTLEAWGNAGYEIVDVHELPGYIDDDQVRRLGAWEPTHVAMLRTPTFIANSMGELEPVRWEYRLEDNYVANHGDRNFEAHNARLFAPFDEGFTEGDDDYERTFAFVVGLRGAFSMGPPVLLPLYKSPLVRQGN